MANGVLVVKTVVIPMPHACTQLLITIATHFLQRCFALEVTIECQKQSLKHTGVRNLVHRHSLIPLQPNCFEIAGRS